MRNLSRLILMGSRHHPPFLWSSFSNQNAQTMAFAALTRQQAVDKLLAGTRTAAQTPQPTWTDAFIPLVRTRDMSDEQRQAFRKDLIAKSIELRAWWYEEMLTTSSPFTERMTLFWHNHCVNLDRQTGRFRFYHIAHDNDTKTVLGQTGNFDGDDVLNILLGKPQTAELITAKLWREFISPKPDEAEINQLAGVFHDNRYDIAALLHALLTTDAFYAPQNRASLVKSPVVLIVGTLRQFDIHPVELRPLLFAARALGRMCLPPQCEGLSRRGCLD